MSREIAFYWVIAGSFIYALILLSIYYLWLKPVWLGAPVPGNGALTIFIFIMLMPISWLCISVGNKSQKIFPPRILAGLLAAPVLAAVVAVIVKTTLLN